MQHWFPISSNIKHSLFLLALLYFNITVLPVNCVVDWYDCDQSYVRNWHWVIKDCNSDLDFVKVKGNSLFEKSSSHILCGKYMCHHSKKWQQSQKPTKTMERIIHCNDIDFSVSALAQHFHPSQHACDANHNDWKSKNTKMSPSLVMTLRQCDTRSSSNIFAMFPALMKFFTLWW